MPLFHRRWIVAERAYNNGRVILYGLKNGKAVIEVIPSDHMSEQELIHVEKSINALSALLRIRLRTRLRP